MSIFRKILFIGSSLLLCACTDIALPFSREALYKTLSIEIPLKYQKDSAVFFYHDAFHKNESITAIPIKEGQSELFIKVHKNIPSPLIFFESNLDSIPIGCIYPIEESMSAYGGFAAFMLFRLYRDSWGSIQEKEFFLSHFNWKAFSQKIQLYENPWLIDQKTLLEDISEGSFSIDSFNIP